MVINALYDSAIKPYAMPPLGYSDMLLHNNYYIISIADLSLTINNCAVVLVKLLHSV